MGDVVARAEGLCKRYGRIHALEDFTTELRRGEIVGLLGPNGAGKSTAMRLMVGLVRPSRGRVELLGRAMPRGRRKVLREVGAIIEEPAFHEHLSGRLNLSFLATYYGGIGDDRIDAVLGRMDLLRRADDPVATYSVGMKGRLALAAALLPSPRLLLLDEPTAGFDPRAVRMVQGLLREEAGERGATILISSHMLDEVERLCDRVLVLRQGRLCGDVQLHDESADWTRLEVADPDDAATWLRARADVLEVADRDGVLFLRLDGTPRRQLAFELIAAGHGIDVLAPHRPPLEELYFDLVPEENDDPSDGH